jgi:uncharacterized repeat protein (TIGR03803 family)
MMKNRLTNLFRALTCVATNLAAQWKTAFALSLLGAMTAIAAHAQTFTTLFSFDGPNGATPWGGLVQATNGDLYGITAAGGDNTSNTCPAFYPNSCGTVFKITTSGRLMTLYSFCLQSGCTDGWEPGPFARLVQATNGDLYGTTEAGGADGGGTVFKITPSGALTPLYSFLSQGSTDGYSPYAGLVQATNGDLYGTTVHGGANGDYGTVFKITPNGTLTTLYSFCAQPNCVDGSQPFAALVQATNGDFYGTTPAGGANGDYGTIFKITPSGTLTTLYSFCSKPNCTDGASPYGALVQATNGDFYGTTYNGGVGAAPGAGTVFRITPNGRLTTLYSFCSQPNCTDGENPFAGLVQGTDGNLYGTTEIGGANNPPVGGYGTVFSITPGGTLTTLYSFCPGFNTGPCTDGASPEAGLVQDTNGTFYGTTASGGANECIINYGSCGTVFSLSVGLGPFVETQTASGKVGATVRILGTDLTAATSVTFNGTAAAFTVVQPSEISATVPTGASTGTVQVVTPSGTLSSNVPFRVLQ